MKKCPNCGALMEADVNFCTKCGTDLRNINNAQANKSELKPNVNSPIIPERIEPEHIKQSTTLNDQQSTSERNSQIESQFAQAKATPPKPQNYVQPAVSNQEQANNQYQTSSSARKEKFNNYWQWCVASWKRPFSELTGESWYGWVTILAEDIVLVLGIYFGMKAVANRYGASTFGLGDTVSGIAFNSTIALLFFSVLFEVIVIGGYYAAYRFIYGHGKNLLEFVNSGVHCSNLNLILSVLTFVIMLLGSSNDSMAALLFLLIIANFFMGFQVTTLGENLKPVHDKMYGYIISFFIIIIALIILFSLIYSSAYDSLMNQLFSAFS
ncbi:zinc ribbon domain-containing protein [Lactobacillus sp. ESL0261]|uniref:zinc ribbon domain-containing protein n=1 Tax=Lactobacillus sp. ESL0261 TaxID=2069348 RepID=UPI000EFB5718|nr:zinc ribbon domain-containing protein [Lactobacillus sp. ESL0261]RMC55625.1 zinc-ribbon domain-containing protein [Lactobacillus sp. ESL0261]